MIIKDRYQGCLCIIHNCTHHILEILGHGHLDLYDYKHRGLRDIPAIPLFSQNEDILALLMIFNIFYF